MATGLPAPTAFATSGGVRPPDVAPVRRAYGPGPAQFGDLYQACPPRRHAAVVVVHGGFWRSRRSLDMTAPLAEALARRGWDAWNIEYRTVGQGSWPATLEDCAAAIDHLPVLASEFSLDLGSTVVLGHSAGGQLAVWSAGRALRVKAVVSVGGVLDLVRAAEAGTGEGAVVEFLEGGRHEVPERYREADPISRLPTGLIVRCLHSRYDERVPFEQSARYVEAARSCGDDADLIEVDGAHADGIDPHESAGRRVLDVLDEVAAQGMVHP